MPQVQYLTNGYAVGFKFLKGIQVLKWRLHSVAKSQILIVSSSSQDTKDWDKNCQDIHIFINTFMLIALPDYTITTADCSIRVLYFSKWKSGYGLVCWLGGKLPLEIPKRLGGKGLLARPWVLLFS